ncbi:MAG TPA: TetR/AcrR family transcriptional regulator [Solirubrobacteraceae bacterium]
MQARSRRTVERILAATEAIIAEQGADAATTRSIATRAGVAAPSLYRFFADRDEILDALLEAMLAELEAHVEEAERGFSGETVEDYVRLELGLHVAYYQRHPSLASLWFGGRVSAAVVELVRARNQRLARRIRQALTSAGLVDSAVPDVVLELLVEYGDRTLDLAFRGGRHPDPEVIETGVTALTAFAERWAPASQAQHESRLEQR